MVVYSKLRFAVYICASISTVLREHAGHLRELSGLGPVNDTMGNALVDSIDSMPKIVPVDN
jgi:hypothetical protein